MSRIDALPADQKSVLQLLLRQGKGYDDLSGLLRLDVGEVRSRAHDALDALGPGAGGVPSARRQEIADWLLGQQGPDEAASTRAFVDGSPAARAWAQAVASELEPLAGGRLPEIPANGVPSATAAAAAPSAAPAATPSAAAAATPSAAAAATPNAAAAPEPSEPAAGTDAAAGAPTPFAPAPTAAPRVSRRGGAALIAGALAVIALVLVLVLVVFNGDDNKDNAKNAATTTTTTQSQPKVQAQVNLTPPQDAPAKKALAIVQIVDANGQEAVNAVSQGLPSTTKAAYAIWVYASPSQAKLIGGFNQKDNNGHLVYQGALPKGFDITSYNEILVTRETSGSPKRPGRVYLRGDIPRSSGG
jgi:hypothetical protein